MAQVTNPAGRIDDAPADAARRLVAAGAIAITLLIGLVIAVQFAPQTRISPVPPNVVKPPVSVAYDGRLDPIELNYISQARGVRRVVAAPPQPALAPQAPYPPNSRGPQQRLIAQ